MMWRCIHDQFGYCAGEPDGADKALMDDRIVKVNGVNTTVKVNPGMGATCSLSPKMCGKRQSFETVCPPSPSEWVEPEVLATAKAVVVEQPAPPKPISKPTSNKSKEKQAQLL